MNGDGTFINPGLNKAFQEYENAKNHPDSLEYNTFLSSIVRMLLIIYGTDVENAYLLNNQNIFYSTLTRHGLTAEDAIDFSILVDKYNKANERQKNKAIKKKNKFFNAVQKYLIDMLVRRNAADKVSEEDLKEFESLLFTANSTEFYRKSVALVSAYNPYEIDEYFKKQKLGG